MWDYQKLLSDIIIKMRDEYVSDYSLVGVTEINNGYCENFASDVIAVLEKVIDEGSKPPVASDLEVANFLEVNPETGCSDIDGAPFDKAMLAESWPGVIPPEGFDWDAMDKLSAIASYGAGTHVFIEMKGRFYDAECPHGVESFFDLPFFKRDIQHFVESGELSPASEISPKI